MNDRRFQPWSRRTFLSSVTGVATVGLVGRPPEPAAAEPPPETTRLRMRRSSTVCFAPQYVAEELLRAEGFTDVQYLSRAEAGIVPKALADGRVDVSMTVLLELLPYLDLGRPVVALAGVHGGCYELVGNDRVRTLRDLKGKTIWGLPDEVDHLFIASMLAYVGLDPKRDVHWLTTESDDPKQLFLEGRTDAILALPPNAQELRARRVGRVILDTARDRPWSQLLCCFVFGNREFVRRHPIATKRALRAILKAADLCSQDPARAARVLVEGKYTTPENSGYALQAMQEIAYSRWREYDPTATVRFFALRLHETGFIRSTPQKILAQGTDWRFLNELKKELKG